MDQLKLEKRLRAYGKMEFLSVLFIPITFSGVMLSRGEKFGWFSFVCYVPTAALLIVGASYWRAKLQRLYSSDAPLKRMLSYAVSYHVVILCACVAAVVFCIIDLFFVDLSRGSGDRYGGQIATTLAVAEYINYYHIQLQHFDHLPDFRRLLKGKGFRKSHLRKDIEKYYGS